MPCDSPLLCRRTHFQRGLIILAVGLLALSAIAFHTVLYAQYMVWIVPLIPLVVLEVKQSRDSNSGWDGESQKDLPK